MLFQAESGRRLLARLGGSHPAQPARSVDQAAAAATTNGRLQILLLIVRFVGRRIIGTAAQGDRADATAADFQESCDFTLREFAAREQAAGFLDDGWRQHGKRSLASVFGGVLFPIAFVPKFLGGIGLVRLIEIIEIIEVILGRFGVELVVVEVIVQGFSEIRVTEDATAGGEAAWRRTTTEKHGFGISAEFVDDWNDRLL